MNTFARMVSVGLCCAVAMPRDRGGEVQTSPTLISFVEADLEFVRAELRSPFKGCVRNREGSVSELGTGLALHTTRSTRDGAFSIALDDLPPGVSAFRIAAAPKAFGSHLCGGDTADVTFDEATLSGGSFGEVFRGVLDSSVAAC